MKTKITFYTATIIVSALKYKILFIFWLLNSFFSFAQNSCSASLNVLNNRNYRSATNEGTYFKMSLTNKSSSTDSYVLSAINNSNLCTNSDGSSILNNVNLPILFKDLNLNEITIISILPEETIEFYVHATVPVGTSIGKWCCTQINATSNTCSSYIIKTNVHTLVINPNDD